VTEGVLDGKGGFKADTVLAKHDENYMPKNVAEALEAKGVKLGASAHPGQLKAEAP
jgi:cytochrome c-type biogenesis protein CcmE